MAIPKSNHTSIRTYQNQNTEISNSIGTKKPNITAQKPPETALLVLGSFEAQKLLSTSENAGSISSDVAAIIHAARVYDLKDRDKVRLTNLFEDKEREERAKKVSDMIATILDNK